MGYVRVQLRGDTSSRWAEVNPVLFDRELGIETDTKKIKVGNGKDAWNDLNYMTQGEKGPPGKDGLPGKDGKDGTDANVTEGSIIEALGYKPVEVKNVSPLNLAIRKVDVL